MSKQWKLFGIVAALSACDSTTPEVEPSGMQPLPPGVAKAAIKALPHIQERWERALKEGRFFEGAIEVLPPHIQERERKLWEQEGWDVEGRLPEMTTEDIDLFFRAIKKALESPDGVGVLSAPERPSVRGAAFLDLNEVDPAPGRPRLQ